ncbi:MAG TPA: hypothetical protein VKU80_05400 [Planctomycetota bacterium]|nr:hypothetical protein [Planctomycetota bacterium]
MNAWFRRVLGAALLLVSGCARPSFTESDLGRTVEVEQGSDFSITLPRSAAGDRQAPEIRGALIRLLDRRTDAGAAQEIFHFMADGAGDAEIRIDGQDQTVPQFVIQVRVLRPSRPSSTPSSGKPPGGY